MARGTFGPRTTVPVRMGMALALGSQHRGAGVVKVGAFSRHKIGKKKHDQGDTPDGLEHAPAKLAAGAGQIEEECRYPYCEVDFFRFFHKTDIGCPVNAIVTGRLRVCIS